MKSHYGHSEGFVLFDVIDNKIIEQKTIMNGGLKGCEMSKLLADYNVETIIVGGIGENAKNNLEKNNIQVLLGATGNINQIILDYLNGNLLINNEVCKEHHHDHHHSHCHN